MPLYFQAVYPKILLLEFIYGRSCVACWYVMQQFVILLYDYFLMTCRSDDRHFVLHPSSYSTSAAPDVLI
jgi:hypothetical protein